MVYANGLFHPVYPSEVHKVKQKRLSKVEKLAKSIPGPGVDQTFQYCSWCNQCRHLRFKKQFLGNIKVSTSCCNTVLGYLDFPEYLKKRLDRKVYVAWLNG